MYQDTANTRCPKPSSDSIFEQQVLFFCFFLEVACEELPTPQALAKKPLRYFGQKLKCLQNAWVLWSTVQETLTQVRRPFWSWKESFGRKVVILQPM